MSETKTHILLTIPPFFEDVASESKPFELRRNDRDFRVGDRLILREYFPITQVYSGLEYWAQITYVLENFPGIEKGYAILGIKKDSENDFPF